MSDNSISIVCKKSRYPNNKEKAQDIKPEWGFSNLGFTFWNWPPFTDQFIKNFKQRLGCDVNIVFSHI